jgi:hypothetical protein
MALNKAVLVKEIPTGWSKINFNGSLENKINELNKRINKVVCLVYNIGDNNENYVGVLDRMMSSSLYQIREVYDNIDFEPIEVDKIIEIYTDSERDSPQKKCFKK